jgi:hypothetical protein
MGLRAASEPSTRWHPGSRARRKASSTKPTELGEERKGFLATVAWSVEGEEDGLGTLWEHTPKVIGQLWRHPSRTDSEPSPARDRVCEVRCQHPPQF